MKKLLPLWLSLGFLHAKNKSEQENPTFIFVHGLMQSSRDMRHYYSPTFNILPGKMILPDLPCAQDMPGRVSNPLKLSLGQAHEMGHLKHVYRNTQGSIVLGGLSMGAATILNFTGTHAASRVKALVIEAPFDHLGNVIRNITSNALPKEQAARFAKIIAWSHYDPNGIQPEKVVENIRKDMPILFIHSKKDLLIPTTASQHLYKLLRNSGHEHVYLLELETGLHSMYQHKLNPVEGRKYLVTVHAFYKKHNLPNDPELAREGEPFLKQCQPNPNLF